MAKPLSFFLGSSFKPNVKHLLNNIGWMLSTERQLHLITSNPEYAGEGYLHHYRVFGDSSSRTKSSIRSLHRYLKRNSPAALVQLTKPPVHGTIVGTAGYLRDIPTVYRYAGDRFYEYRVARGRKKLTAFGIGSILGRVPIRLTTKFIALGPVGQRRLIARGVSPEGITVLPPSINEERFKNVSPEVSGTSPDEKIVLVVGRVSHLKGVKTLERVIPRLHERRRDLQFFVAGPIEEQLTIPKKFENHVTLMGAVPPNRVPQIMKAADVLVHPSLTEGIPRVLLEALAVNTPVVARNVGDIASVTENTFRCDSELINMVSNLESLPLDPINPFSRRTLAPRYREFFRGFE